MESIARVVLLAAGLASAALADAAAKSSCAAPTGPSYVLPSQADLVVLLPPPPAPDSEAERRDVQAVLDAQRAAHANGSTAHAIDDAAVDCTRFDDVLGAALKSKDGVAAMAFVTKAAIEGGALTAPAKKYWKRARPYVVSVQVERLGDVAPDAKPSPDNAGDSEASPDCKSEPSVKTKAERDKAAKQSAHASYPSFHAAFGTLCALVLADMVPEQRAALFERARGYAASRLVVGAHFPDDLESGRVAGTVAMALLLENPRFQHDLADARAQLRAALGLPASSPDLQPRAGTP